MNGKTVGFFDKDSSKAYEQVKDELYARLCMITDQTRDEAYRRSPEDEQTFLRNLIDKMERS